AFVRIITVEGRATGRARGESGERVAVYFGVSVVHEDWRTSILNGVAMDIGTGTKVDLNCFVEAACPREQAAISLLSVTAIVTRVDICRVANEVTRVYLCIVSFDCNCLVAVAIAGHCLNSIALANHVESFRELGHVESEHERIVPG